MGSLSSCQLSGRVERRTACLPNPKHQPLKGKELHMRKPSPLPDLMDRAIQPLRSVPPGPQPSPGAAPQDPLSFLEGIGETGAAADKH